MQQIFRFYAKGNYREDIQGIRAIGALLILVYHIWVHKVSGGVDVFFVISGFLMTGILLRQFGQEGKIRPLQFWGRIIKRVAPSAYLVLLATFALGYFYIPSPFWRSSIREVLYSAVHLENLQLMRLAVDYLAGGSPPSAVQQFWALSMQVQFYALLPFALLGALCLTRRTGSSSPLVISCAVIFLASLAYSILATAHDPVTAYFNTGARIWEFFAGVLLAALLPSLRVSRPLGRLLGVLGLSLLLLGGLLIPDSLHFPGYAALIPVGAAVMLILSGAQGQDSTVGRFLSNPFLVAMGGISFTIYLWHWPLLVFYQHHIGSTEVSLPAGLLIILASIGVAYVTSKGVEEPFRKIGPRSVAASYLVGIVFFSPVVTAGMIGKSHIDDIQEDRIAYWNRADIPRFSGDRIEIDMLPVHNADFISARKILPEPYENGCHQEETEPAVTTCAYGDESAEKTVVLVGGSHAVQWLPVLDEIGREQGVRIVNMTKSACPFGPLEESNDSCREWNEGVVEMLMEIRPTMVITNSTRSGRKGAAEHTPASYGEQWRRLENLGIEVVGIRDNPWFDFDVPQCVSENRGDPLDCSVSRTSVYLPEDPARTWERELSNFFAIDTSDLFCAEVICPPVYRVFLMYRDDQHIAVPYVRFLKEWLTAKLMKIHPGLFAGALRSPGP